MSPMLLRLILAMVPALVRSASAADWTTLPPMTASTEALLAAAAAAPGPAPGAVLLEDVRWEVHADGTMTRTAHVVRYARDERLALGVVRVSAAWSPWYQDRPEISGRVVAADGSEQFLDPSTLVEQIDPAADMLVFTDLHAVSGLVGEAHAGSVVETLLVEREHTAFSGGVADAWRVGNGLPTVLTRLHVEAPKGRVITTKADGVPSGSRVYTRRGGRDVTLELHDLPPVSVPDGPAGPATPQWPRFGWSTSSGWQALAVEYGRVAEGSIAPMDVTAYGISPSMSVEEKVRLLFAVAQRLRYVAVQFGDGSIVPKPVASTLETQFGDCKAKAVLLVSLLRSAGVEASVALLRSGRDADIQPDVPAIQGFNHAIVYLPGTPGRWLDPTSPYVSADSVPAEDQGRWALVSGERGGLLQIPVAGAEHNRGMIEREITLRPLALGGLVETRSYSGLLAAAARRSLEGAGGVLDPAGASDAVLDGLGGSGLHGVYTEGGAPPRDPERLGFALEQTTIARGDWYSYSVRVDDKPLRTSVLGWSDDGSATSGIYLPAQTLYLAWRLVAPPGVVVLRGFPPVEAHAGPVSWHAALSPRPDEAARVVYNLDTGDGVVAPAQIAALREVAALVNGEPVRLQLADPVGAEILAGHRSAALRLLHEAVIAAPTDFVVRARFAESLAAAGFPEAARREADAAVRAAPSSALAHAWAGRTFSYGSDGSLSTPGAAHDRAVDELEVALSLDPTLYTARESLVALLASTFAARPGAPAHPGLEPARLGFQRAGSVPVRVASSPSVAPEDAARARAAERDYSEAVALLVDQTGLGVKRDRATYGGLSRFETHAVDPANPRDLPLRLTRLAYGLDLPEQLYSKGAVEAGLPARGTAAWLGLQLRGADLHAETALGAAGDRLLSSGEVSVDEDAAGDVRVSWRTLAYGTLTLFAVREGGALRLCADQDLADLGWEALRRVERGDVTSGRALVDWAIEAAGTDPAGGVLSRPYAAIVLAEDGAGARRDSKGDLKLAAATLLTRSRVHADDSLWLLAAGHLRTGAAGAAVASAEVNALMSLDRYAAAAVAADRLPALVPMDSGLLNTVAMAWLAAGRLDEVRALLTDWCGTHPEDREAIATLALAEVRAGDIEAFTRTAARLEGLPLSDRAARRLAASILLAAESDPAAVSLANHVVSLLNASTAKVPSPLLISAQIDIGDVEGARQTLGRILAETPPWTWASNHLDYYRGRLAESLGLPEVAKELYALEPAAPPGAPLTDERLAAARRRAALEQR